MNSNELADELTELIVAPTPVDDKWACELIDKSATMLRQQQAEIEALKTRIEYMREKASLWEAEAHVGGVEAGKKLAQAEIDLLKADMRLLLKEYHQYWKEKNDTV